MEKQINLSHYRSDSQIVSSIEKTLMSYVFWNKQQNNEWKKFLRKDITIADIIFK